MPVVTSGVVVCLNEATTPRASMSFDFVTSIKTLSVFVPLYVKSALSGITTGELKECPNLRHRRQACNACAPLCLEK